LCCRCARQGDMLYLENKVIKGRSWSTKTISFVHCYIVNSLILFIAAEPIGSMSSMEVNVDMLEQMDLMDMSDQEALDVFLNSGEDDNLPLVWLPFQIFHLLPGGGILQGPLQLGSSSRSDDCVLCIFHRWHQNSQLLAFLAPHPVAADMFLQSLYSIVGISLK
uniref:Uncharacterized protein n=1 Tax=Gopherus agassizii TaxID=38772 RepID=A0A452GXA6_9SAUR